MSSTQGALAGDPSKEVRLLLAFFGESRLPRCRHVEADDVPEPYHGLLVHDDHMTVTLETYYGEPVRVRPYQVHRQGEIYGRKLDLMVGPNDTVVMTGMMLMNFRFVSPEVQELIVSQKIPLGRILIEHNILRRVTSESFVLFDAGDPLAQRFGLAEPKAAYGRLATIFCDEKPAIDLLEIVRPE